VRKCCDHVNGAHAPSRICNEFRLLGLTLARVRVPLRWTLALGAASATLALLVWLVREPLGWRLPPVLEPHPALEYRLRPDQDVMRFGKRVIVNQWGMRSPPLPARKTDPAELRVLVFGDSVVAGVGFNDHSTLATTLLQQQLAASLRRPVTVGNVAAGSWGPANWRGWASAIGFLDADIVVLVASAHDCDDEPEYRPMHPAPRPFPAPLVPMVEFAAEARVAVQGLLRGDEPPPVDPTQPIAAPSLPALREFLGMARAGVPAVAVVLHPEVSELDEPLAAGRAAIADLATNLGIAVVDAAAEYRAARAAGDTLYHDSIHPTDQGQRALAAALERAVGLASAEREPR
jgi:lysophospholipase L1-like esterase